MNQVPVCAGGQVPEELTRELIIAVAAGQRRPFPLVGLCGLAPVVRSVTGGTSGYWSGLAPHHTYDIELIPANANRQELPNAQVGWINVVTP